jgi:hypothetical protein
VPAELTSFIAGPIRSNPGCPSGTSRRGTPIVRLVRARNTIAERLSMMINVRDLHPGDLLLHSSRGEISKLIKWASDSDYSHVAMVFRPDSIAEATSSGVRYETPLFDRIKDDQHRFFRIDAVRPTGAGEPMRADVLLALQDSAIELRNSKFALNQLFELGVICAIRNKLPTDPIGQALLTWIFETLVKPDSSRLLCSEFVYLAFHNAQTSPPGLIDPTINPVSRPDHPFPKDVDWLALLKEYQDAQGHGQDEPAALVAAIESVAQAGTPLQANGQALRRAFTAVRRELSVARSGWSSTGTAASVSAARSPNPELVDPQSFAESPSFRPLGTVVV